MAAINPLMIFVCFARSRHEWKLFARYSWVFRTHLLVCERCSVCGTRRPLSVKRDYARAR